MVHISVMIPTYNREVLVVRTIESILKQTHTDFTIVVVDDGSKDNTVEAVKEICKRDARVRLEVNPKNLGLTRNWNRCLELAEGPLVQIMQSDDMIDPDYFEHVSAIFEQYPNVGIVAATCRYIDIDDQVTSSNPPIEPRLYRAGDEAVTALITGGYPHVSSIIVRRECVDKMGGYNTAIWHGPDMEFDVRIASQYDFYHFGKVFTSFRRHGSNMGDLEYLRRDFLTVDVLKRKLTLNYLSPAGLKVIGIADVDQHVDHEAAHAAIQGSIVMTAHGHFALSWYYLRMALSFNAGAALRAKRFWRALAVALVPPLGQYILRRRLKISHTDDETREAVHQSLLDQQKSPTVPGAQ